MRILIALTYYRPHVSGVTIYAERLARGLARRGHRVTVLTSRFARSLPAVEQREGVRLVRIPVAARVSKGVVMPLVPFYAALALRGQDVANVHLPQLEAALIAGLARLFRIPAVLTYHCDLDLPPGWFNRLVQGSLEPLNAAAANLANAIVINTADYGSASPFLSRYAEKLRPILPPIAIGEPDDGVRREIERTHALGDRVRIGFAARFAAEKGVEHLLAALPRVIEEFPGACVVFTGASQGTVGEDAYRRRLDAAIERYRAHLTFLDLLPDEHMASFFSLCDVLAVPSVNSTESFGLVQAEAMLCGTPVVATDLPGIREAVRLTGMGRIVPAADPEALAGALIEVLRHPGRYRRPRSDVQPVFDVERTLDRYEELFAAVAR